MNKKKLGLTLALSTAFISGLSIFINKFGVEVINSSIFAGAKNIIVLLLISSWLWLAKDWSLIKQLKKKQWFMLVIIGLVGGSLPFLLFFKGLALTNPAQAAFIHKSLFIYAALLALIFLKEKINKNILIGALLVLLGNLLLFNLIPTGLNFGDLLIFLATLLWALESVISKKALENLNSRIVIWGRMFFGSLFICGYLVLSGQAQLLSALNLNQIGWLMITAVFLFGYVATWYEALKHLKVSVATAILSLGSPITLLLSFFFLGGSIQPLEFLGIILIGLGIIGIIGFKSIFSPKGRLLKT